MRSVHQNGQGTTCGNLMEMFFARASALVDRPRCRVKRELIDEIHP